MGHIPCAMLVPAQRDLAGSLDQSLDVFPIKTPVEATQIVDFLDLSLPDAGLMH